MDKIFAKEFEQNEGQKMKSVAFAEGEYRCMPKVSEFREEASVRLAQMRKLYRVPSQLLVERGGM